MSHEHLMAALGPFINRFQRLLENDPVLRSEVRTLGKALLALAEEPQLATPEYDAAALPAPELSAPTELPSVAEPPTPLPISTNGKEPAEELAKPLPKPTRFVQPTVRPAPAVVAWKPTPVTDEDLPLIAA